MLDNTSRHATRWSALDLPAIPDLRGVRDELRHPGGSVSGFLQRGNTPALTLAPTTPSGALTQCYMSCTSQALLCKQSCPPPH